MSDLQTDVAARIRSDLEKHLDVYDLIAIRKVPFHLSVVLESIWRSFPDYTDLNRLRTAREMLDVYIRHLEGS